MAGGLSLHALRQLNTRAVRRAAAALDGGDARRLERLHAASIVRDAGRAAVVTALGLVLAQVARAYLAGALPPHGVALLNVAAVGAALAAGAAARAEHDGGPRAQVERLRTALCGPLGSLGDRLVWAGWLPLTSALALIGVALGLGLPAVLGFVVVYNVGHVALRWWALRAGWTYGARVAQALREPLLQRATALSGPAMALGVGAALPLVAQYLSGALFGWARLALAGVVAGGFALVWWQRRRLTGLRLGLAP